MDEQELLKRITSNLNILGGKPIIRGRCLGVEPVLGMLAAGDTFDTLLEGYPWLEKADIQACLLYAQRLVRQECPKLSIDDLTACVPKILEQAPYIKLLVLFGSRARGFRRERQGSPEGHRSADAHGSPEGPNGDATPDSDWDFAFLCDEELRKQYEKEGWDFYRVWGILQDTYKLLDDQIDVVDIESCSDLLAHQIAQDGQMLYEREPGEFTAFKQKKLMTPEEMKRMRRELRDEIKHKLQELQQ